MSDKVVKIVVLDDDESQSLTWSEYITDALDFLGLSFEVLHPSADNLKSFHEKLVERQERAREGDGGYGAWESAADEPPYDQADLIVIDFELLRFPSGHELAYLTRCFSKCRYVAVMNEMEHVNQFDLRMQEDQRHFADVIFADPQLANPGLWSGHSYGYRPWLWPSMLAELERSSAREQFVAEHLNEQVFEAIGLQGIADWLTTDAKAALSMTPDGREFDSLTFSDIAKTPSGWRRTDRVPDDHRPRVIAARVAKWLRIQVLAAQEALVDLPHLISRYPSLATSTNLEDWDEASADLTPGRLKFDFTPAGDPWGSARLWLGRDAWLGSQLATRDTLQENVDPLSSAPSGFVFLEDLSRFAPREAAREFVPMVTTSRPIRFVSNPDSDWIRTRIAEVAAGVSELAARAVDPGRVSYEPRVFLAS